MFNQGPQLRDAACRARVLSQHLQRLAQEEDAQEQYPDPELKGALRRHARALERLAQDLRGRAPRARRVE